MQIFSDLKKALPVIALVLTVFGIGTGCATSMSSVTTYHHDINLVTHLIEEEISSRPSRKNHINASEIAREIVTLSHYYELDPLLVLSIVKVESQFNPRARSSAGAIGLMQVMPIVIREVGYDIHVAKREELLDHWKNLHIGIHYFTFLLNKYQNIQNALIAYNLGPTALDAHLANQRRLPLSYYRKIMESYQTFQKKARTYIEFA